MSETLHTTPTPEDYKNASGGRNNKEPLGNGYPGGPKFTDYLILLVVFICFLEVAFRIVLPWILHTFFPLG